MALEDQLEFLASKGCTPSLYRRGKVWRAHINAAGNFWADDKNSAVALQKVVALWEEKGCPLDGMSA